MEDAGRLDVYPRGSSGTFLLLASVFVMKVLHILDHSIPLQSGYASRTLSILRHQHALGWSTAQVTSWKHGASASTKEIVDGIAFHRTAVGSSRMDEIPYLNQVRVINSLQVRLREVIEEFKPDVLHAHSPALNGIAALIANRRFRLPLVYEMRASWEDAAVNHGTTRHNSVRYRLSRAIETLVLRRADAIATICQGLERDIVTRGISEDKVTVVPNSINLGQFVTITDGVHELKRDLGLAECVVVGFIGTFFEYEGLDTLCEAVPELLSLNDKIRVVLIGGGPEESALRELVTRRGLAEKIIFAGRIPHEKVSDYYDIFDVLVYPRKSIRLTEIVTPLKPLEAMAKGRAVAASDVGGHRELIRDGENGVLFRPSDPTDLARAVAELVANENLRDCIGENGRRFVEKERNWRTSVKRYAAVYEKVGASPAA